MKKLFATLAGFSAALTLSSQCPTYYPVAAGEMMEMTNYDKKDKVTGKTQTTVQSVEGNTINLLNKSFDDKGKEVSTMEFTVTCEADALRIDMKNFMPPESTSAYEGMEGVTIEFEGDQLTFPSNLSVGQELADGSMVMKVLINGTPLMTTTVNITNRRVEAMEDVTTPMGTFSCYKLTYDTASKVMMMNTKGKGVEWINSDKGLIKQESYNDNGNLQGSSVRTA